MIQDTLQGGTLGPLNDTKIQLNNNEKSLTFERIHGNPLHCITLQMLHSVWKINHAAKT